MKFSRHVKVRAFGSLTCLAAFLLVTVSSAVLTASPASATSAASVRPLGSTVRIVNLASARPVASPVTASSNLPTCPEVVVASDLPCTLPEAHKCVDLGNYNGTHAIFCVDLRVDPVAGSKSVTVGLQVSGYCQNAAGYAQCATINVYGGTYDPYTTDKDYHWNKYCGHGGTNPDCAPNGRNYFSHDDITVPTGSSDEIWGVIWFPSVIFLPGDEDYFYLTGNFETGHVHVTNNL
jgi:hypothetical protein